MRMQVYRPTGDPNTLTLVCENPITARTADVAL
jgi:hypothetical protein